MLLAHAGIVISRRRPACLAILYGHEPPMILMICGGDAGRMLGNITR